MFDRVGQILVEKEDVDMSADDLMLIALDAGAEDFNEEEEGYEILTQVEDLSKVRESLEQDKIPMVKSEITMLPQNYVKLTDEEDIKNMERILDLLDEDDDVQEVYHNWEDEE